MNTLEMWMDHVGPLSGDCRVLRFDYPHNYYVDLSEKLLKIKLDLLNAGGKSQG